jgi:hypothetical protein
MLLIVAVTNALSCFTSPVAVRPNPYQKTRLTLKMVVHAASR